MTLLSVFESLVLAGWVCMTLYGFISCIISWVTKRREAPLIWPRHVFAILIPAENAEKVIGRTLDRLLKDIRYPRSMFDLIIVPVNSTDETTTIAKQKGATVYGPGKRRWRDRNDAIQSALERLSTKRRHDAYVILDTVVEVSPNFLTILSDKLSKGAKIIQSGYRFAGPATSWKSGVMAAVHAISPSLFTLWTSRYRLAVGLRHMGMCMSREVVEKYGVRTPAVTDDLSYITHLLLDDVAVVFAPQAIVYDHGHTAPPVRTPMEYIGMRWRLMRQYAFRLIRDGLRWRSAAQLTGGLNLLMPPFSLLLGGAILFMGVSLYTHGLTLNAPGDGVVLGWGLVILALFALVAIRLAHTGAPVMAYLALPSLPLYYIWRSVHTPQDRGEEDQETAPGQIPMKLTTSKRRRGGARRGMRRQTS